MTMRAFCIHAHFYQPPREDPLTGVIPPESGAAPYPNWNERIHAECYRPNAELGNFSRISFNIGPTLFDWMFDFDVSTSQSIVAQDRANVRRFGVGNAIAQPYNHTILPLASRQDKLTQVYWGLRDFEHRFGRKAQGMWLPETAVDLETLSALAQQGVEFTILAPWQVQEDNPDVTEPYWVELPGGKTIAVFLYHAGLSGGISFNPSLTVNADVFARHQLASQFRAEKTGSGEAQLILLATDGELYGHHQPWRDLFLQHLVNGASGVIGVMPTFPALWLRQHPPRRSIGIRERTSWSCHHGVTRWMDSCDCIPGDGSWKRGLRAAFDALAQEIDRLYLQFVAPHVADPWALRHQYIEVMLGNIPAEQYIRQRASRPLDEQTVTRIHLLLEAQRERQRMYTSCGWFFDDFDRIEPKNNLAYAAQAVRLCHIATSADLQALAVAELEKVVSQRSGVRAHRLFLRHMRRAMLDGRLIVGD